MAGADSAPQGEPGKYSYASAGNGTTLHLSGELFKVMAKVDMVHVPYRGAAPAMQDLLAGQVNMIFDNIPGALAQLRAARCAPRRHLEGAHLGRARRPGDLRDLPGFDIRFVDHLTGPAKLPTDIVARLSELSKKALESEDIKAKFLDLAATAIWCSPADTPRLSQFGGSRLCADHQGARRTGRLIIVFVSHGII